VGLFYEVLRRCDKVLGHWDQVLQLMLMVILPIVAILVSGAVVIAIAVGHIKVDLGPGMGSINPWLVLATLASAVVASALGARELRSRRKPKKPRE
jgi:membrane protein implicated in regulation of membrane protease activity